MKKFLAILTAIFIIIPFAVSCGNNENISSVPVSSEVTSSEESSSEASSETKKEESKKESSTNKTSSVKNESEESSSRKNAVRPGNEEDTSSKTESESIKIYKNNTTPQIMSYHLDMSRCDFLGSSESAREEEFTDMVNAGYFNSYLLSMDKYLVPSAKIIAEAGGTFWICPGKYNSSSESINSYIEGVKPYIDTLTKLGYGNLINGFHWDEPIWTGQTNADYLAMTKALYQNFGLRNYPVFATGEFSAIEGNDIGLTADQMRKSETASLVYTSDIGFDTYWVDVRDGVDYTHKLPEWQSKISPNIVDGKSYYTEYKELLKRHAGHPINVWYYPCAYKNATEDYAIAHLEFMAEDILKEEYVGGVVIYTYYPYSELPCFRMRANIKDEYGNYKYKTKDLEVWEKYCSALQRIRKQFDSISAKLVKLDV